MGLMYKKLLNALNSHEPMQVRMCLVDLSVEAFLILCAEYPGLFDDVSKALGLK